LLGLEDGDGVVGETIVRDASTLYEIVTQQWHSNKKIAVVGEHLHGKSAIIGYLKTYIERK
jgi:DNA helicase TIP49 (TBP-interacting protein)